MKYLVAATGPDLDATIARRFGHARYFLIIDPDTLNITAIGPRNHDEPGHGLGDLKDEGIERIIVGNIGPEAFSDVMAMGWTPYLCRNQTVREAVQSVQAGQVAPLREPTVKKSLHSGHHHKAG